MLFGPSDDYDKAILAIPDGMLFFSLRFMPLCTIKLELDTHEEAEFGENVCCSLVDSLQTHCDK